MRFSAQLLPPRLLPGFSSWLCRGHSCICLVCGRVVVRGCGQTPWAQKASPPLWFCVWVGVRSKCRWLAKLPWVCSRLAASSVLCVQGMWSVRHTPQGPSRFQALPLNFCLFLHCQPPLLGPQPFPGVGFLTSAPSQVSPVGPLDSYTSGVPGQPPRAGALSVAAGSRVPARHSSQTSADSHEYTLVNLLVAFVGFLGPEVVVFQLCQVL